jgi:hypothetical protein
MPPSDKNNMPIKVLTWVGVWALVVLSLFLLALTQKSLNTATSTNVVSFSGEGKVVAKPDIAVSILTIVTEAKTSKVAQDENSVKSKATVDFLKAQGIADKDMKVTGYNIYPQYSYPRPYSGSSVTVPRISGYQVNETIQVKIRDLEKASTILDGVVATGVNSISDLSFQIDEPEKLKEEARAKAIADAKAKASILQKQLGIRLGRIISFNEGGGYPMYMRAEVMSKDAGYGMGGDGPVPSLPAGENEINVNVTITYQIK